MKYIKYLVGWMLVAVPMGNAGIVLSINVSNASAVTFTATGVVPDNDPATVAMNDGFTIENFFTSNQSIFVNNITGQKILGGNLSPNGNAEVYNRVGTFEFSDNDGFYKSGNDLSFVNTDAGILNQDQVFSTASAAFSGTATLDLSGSAAALPTFGASGTLYSGFLQSGTSGHGTVIGQYTVVPEPEAYGLGIGLLMLGALLAKRTRGQASWS